MLSAMKTLSALIVLCLSNGALAHKGPRSVVLGTAGHFAILAKSGVSTVPSSVITGDVGVSPAAGTLLTGFSDVKAADGKSATSKQVNGYMFAANYAVPTPSYLTTAVGDMQTAYTDAAGRSKANYTDLHAGAIGGRTLLPGLYKWNTGVTINSTVTLKGNSTDTWIFQIAQTLITSSDTKITLLATGSNGSPSASNIVWAVAGAVTLGTNSKFDGVILGATAITLKTGASIKGRLLSQTAVNLQKATVNA